MTDHVEAAKSALKRPSDYGYYGDLDMFNTWGFVKGMHRDSDLLELSNFDVWVKEMEEFDEEAEQWNIVGSSHWAVGWTRTIAVQVLKEEGEVTEENITDIFRLAVELKESEEHYAILDEDDFSMREYDAVLDSIRQEAPSFIKQEEGWEGEIYSWLTDKGNYAEPPDYWYDETSIVEAAYDLGMIDPEYEDEWKEWFEETPKAMAITNVIHFAHPGTAVICARCGEESEASYSINGQGYCSLFCADRHRREQAINQTTLELENG